MVVDLACWDPNQQLQVDRSKGVIAYFREKLLMRQGIDAFSEKFVCDVKPHLPER